MKALLFCAQLTFLAGLCWAGQASGCRMSPFGVVRHC